MNTEFLVQDITNSLKEYDCDSRQQSFELSTNIFETFELKDKTIYSIFQKIPDHENLEHWKSESKDRLREEIAEFLEDRAIYEESIRE
jgi:hypothetical protein